jgi:hypothetical protein
MFQELQECQKSVICREAFQNKQYTKQIPSRRPVFVQCLVAMFVQYTTKWIILMRNPGCQLEHVPYTETRYAPADISDTSGDTKYGNSLTTPTCFQPYASTRQEPLPSTDMGPIANVEAWILAASAPPLFRGMWAAPS